MPIFQIHTIAAKRLSDSIHINDFGEFLIGTVFPDAMWRMSMEDAPGQYKDWKNDLKYTDELHYAEHDSKNIRMPNYLHFNTEYAKMLTFSDFFRGYAFHLILDYLNNLLWSQMCTIHGDSSFTMKHFDSATVQKFKDENALLNYKYEWQLSWANKYDRIRPRIVQNMITNRLTEHVDKLFRVSYLDLQTQAAVMCWTEMEQEGKGDVTTNFEFFERVVDNAIAVYKGLAATWQ